MTLTTQADSKRFALRYGPWALVAGASEGLGAEYAHQLAALGLNLVLVARRVELVQTLAAEISRKYGVEVSVLVIDLAKAEAASLILNAIRSIDVGLLVYNAAYSAVGLFLERSLDDHLKEVDTNIRTPLILAHAFGQRQIERKRGGLILMSSLSARQGSAYVANYAATKAFSAVLGEGLWEEWRKRGVDVLVCIPSAVRTPKYLASLTPKKGPPGPGALEPRVVVSAALSALGKQPSVVPGLGNRLADFFMRHILSRQAAIRMMGSVMRNLYGH